MHVCFIEPSFPANQRQFVRALREAGAKVTGIGEIPLEGLNPDVKSWLYKYIHVPTVVSDRAVHNAVKQIQAEEPIDRIEATVEAHMMTCARVREACGIPGPSVQTTYLCRDKPAMKEALRNAGVSCANSIGTDKAQDVRDFAKQEGYPIIIKPRDAAGAAGTWKVDSDQQLESVLDECGVNDGRSVAVEEFIEGHEGFYDTITIDGQVLHDFATHYYPGVLEAMRSRDTHAMFVTTNRLDQPSYDEIKEMGRKVIETLGIGTSATHMEWFFGPKGLKFSEIGCRPPGVGAWDVYSMANDFDIYKEWAMAICHGRGSQRPSRRYSAAMLSLRPDGDGRIVAYENMDEIERMFGEYIQDAHIPPVGSGAKPVEGGYMANAWMRIKHPDYDECKRICDVIGRNLKIRTQ